MKFLTEDCSLHTVLRLPRGTLTPYSQGVKANVIFFTKGYATETTWIYDARTNVEQITKKDRPLTAEHFREFDKCYGTDSNDRGKRKASDSKEDRWRSFDISEVKGREFKLDGLKWLKEESLEDGDELPSPEELAAEAISELEAAVAELNQVLALLEKAANQAPDSSPDVPETWKWKLLSEIASIRGGVTKGRRFNGRKTIQLPYLRVANVQDGYLDLTEIKFIEALPEDRVTYALQAGDILFTEGGDRDKLGRGTVWRGEIAECIHQNHIFRARLTTNDLVPDYVSIASKSAFSRQYYFENASQTVNLASINLTMLGALPLPIPPFDEQEEIIRRVDGLLVLANQIEARHAAAETYVARLTESLMTKTFRGELVPTEAELARAQCRHYESAEELLARTRHSHGDAVQAASAKRSTAVKHAGRVPRAAPAARRRAASR